MFINFVVIVMFLSFWSSRPSQYINASNNYSQTIQSGQAYQVPEELKEDPRHKFYPNYFQLPRQTQVNTWVAYTNGLHRAYSGDTNKVQQMINLGTEELRKRMTPQRR